MRKRLTKAESAVRASRRATPLSNSAGTLCCQNTMSDPMICTRAENPLSQWNDRALNNNCAFCKCANFDLKNNND